MGEKLIRKQIYLTVEEERGLRQLSFLKKASQADIIREALDDYLARDQGQAPGVTSQLEKKRGDKADITAPLDGIIGLAGDLDAPEDLSSRHDFYLYGGKDT